MKYYQKLNQARKDIQKLGEFLRKHKWLNAHELVTIFETANHKIDQLHNKAMNDVLTKLRESYLREAELWVENKKTNADGSIIKLSGPEQKIAQTELRKIRQTIVNLNDIFKKE